MKDYFEHIEEYIEGRLSTKERIEFELEMKKDPNLSEAIKNFPFAKKLSASLIEDETRQLLHNLKTKPNNSYSYFLKIAIVLFFFMLILYFLYNKNKASNTIDKKQLFAQLYEAPPSMASRNENNLLTALDSAIYYFDQRNLENSKLLFEKLFRTDSLNSLLIRYLANIHLIQSNYPESEAFFIKLLSIGSADQINEAEYNLLMIYLIQNKKKEAIQLFDSLRIKNIISEKKMDLLNDYIKRL